MRLPPEQAKKKKKKKRNRKEQKQEEEARRSSTVAVVGRTSAGRRAVERIPPGLPGGRERTEDMLVAAFAVLFLRLPRSDHAAAPPLAAPANVTMETMNTDYVLRWDWDQSWGQDVTFTTQYISHSKARNPHRQDQWEELCANLTHHSCDLSGAGLMYEGKYLVRVRAEADGSCSQWASLTFHPDKDARVGPPSRVSLSHADGAVDVHIEDPLSGANTSMRTLLPGLSYHILYWEGPGPPQSSQVQNLSSKATLVTLSGLKGRTCYCVAVQTLNRYHPKKSSFTSPICIQTPGALVWWLSVLCFLGSMLGCFLLGFFFYKTSKWLQTVFFPASQLPSHFKEYLCDFPGSDMPRLLTSDAEQRCDKVVVCPRWPPEEQDPPPEAVAASPPGLEADSSQQGGSRDSGVYSAHSGQQGSGGWGLSWTDLCGLDQLATEAGAPGLGGGAVPGLCA